MKQMILNELTIVKVLFTLSIYMPQRIGPYSKNTLTLTDLLNCHEKTN